MYGGQATSPGVTKSLSRHLFFKPGIQDTAAKKLLQPVRPEQTMVGAQDAAEQQLAVQPSEICGGAGGDGGGRRRLAVTHLC